MFFYKKQGYEDELELVYFFKENLSKVLEIDQRVSQDLWSNSDFLNYSPGRNTNRTVTVVQYNREIIGVLVIDETNKIEINVVKFAIALEEEYKRDEIETQIIEHVIETKLTKRTKKFTLVVREHNVSLQSLLKEKRFLYKKTLPRYYNYQKTEEDGYLMQYEN